MKTKPGGGQFLSFKIDKLTITHHDSLLDSKYYF